MSHPHPGPHDGHDHGAHSHGHRHHHAHDHHHDHAAGASDTRLRTALILIAGFMWVEVAAGLWSGSLALLADAGHMLADAASLALALYAAAASRRPADAHRTYGYARTRVLAAFVNGLSLLLIAGWIVAEALMRLREPVSVLAGPMLAVAVAGLLVNLMAWRVLSGGEDMNTRAALAHVLSDILGSAAAIAAALIILATGWTAADPLLSLLVALLIARSGWSVTRESAHVLLEGAPPGLDLQKLAAELPAAVPGVLEAHHLHAWMLAPQDIQLTLHVHLSEGMRADAAIAAISEWLREHHRISHSTVQVEYAPCAQHQH